jgi:GAF domain-containing protein
VKSSVAGASGPPSLPGLARLLLSEKTVSDLFDVIVNVAILAVSGVNGASVSVLIGDRPWFGTTKASSAKVRAIDEAQYERAEGPSVEAILMSQEVGVGVPTSRWPQFSEQAVLAGMLSVWSLPLTFAERTTGALNLYSAVGQPWSTTTARAARRLGGQAAIVLAYAVRLASAELANHRHHALADRDVIGQAMDMLRAPHAITADQALDILRRVSQHSGRKLQEIAGEVVRGLAQPEGQV